MKQHLPQPGYGAGLRAEAYCGRYATYQTGDHAMILRLARADLRRGDTSHLCARCLGRFRAAEAARSGSVEANRT